MARALQCLMWLALALSGCGQIRIIGEDDASLGADISGGSDVVSDASDATATDGQNDSVAGCQSDDDCKGIKGKTPCKYPTCDKTTGQCKLQLRAVGDLCTDPFSDPVACQETRCDGSGLCAAQAQVDGTVCGLGACGNACKSGVCLPATAADYDDKNPCTNDYCDQGKVIEHEPLTNPALLCDDGDSCTQSDACIAGVCQGAAIGCSDDIDCTLDTCSKTAGCQHTPKLGVCTDGNPCTKDACDLAVGCTVVGFEIGTCDDNNACSETDLCDKGTCKGKPSSDASCACASDAQCVGKATDMCGQKYKCDTQISVCVPKANSVVICDTSKDGACQQTACEPTSGSCVTTPVAGSPACDDGNACTSASTCSGGVCLGAQTADCTDNNPCTLDSCAGDVGCVHAPGGDACEDGNLCTINDVCQGSTCAGTKKACDDGLLCTFDSCDGKTGECQHLGDVAACDDKNPCTTDSCDVALDCQHAINDAGTCDDGNVCTADSCKGGKCVSLVKCDCAVDLDCDDKNPCTTDVCQAGKCATKNADGNACSPGDKCQKPGSGICTGGACTAGNAPVDCSGIADACNAGVCDASTGKCQTVAKPAGTACDDGDGCTQDDVCAGGTCASGAPVVCGAPSGKPCQQAKCVSTGAQSHICPLTAKPLNTACDDGLFCTIGEQCDADGNCVGSAFPCTSGSACVLATCSEAQKGCVNTNADKSQPCDDGLYCTVADTCDGNGGCTSGLARVCGGGDCLVGVCDEPSDQCLTQPAPGCCVADAGCDDGFACTVDSCVGGTCSHAAGGSCCSPVLWANSFDTGTLAGMTFSNSSGGVTLGWQVRAGAVFNSASTALYYGNPATNNFDFGASFGTASTPQMQLPSTFTSMPMLAFSVWFDTEGGNVYDVLTVNMVATSATGAQTTTAIWSKPQATAMATWQAYSVPLPSTAMGQSVHFDFTFNTVDGVANVGQGVYVDDIQVQVTCP